MTRELFNEDLPAAVAVLAEGGVVVLVDEEADSGDLVMAASTVTAAGINLLAKHGRGLTSLALSAARVQALALPPMAASWGPPRKPFTVSIEARDGVATGISAADRARTIRVAVDPAARPDDLISPGHVFPLRAHPSGLGGARTRVEAALALAARAGLGDGAVLTEILDDQGELASLAPVATLAARLRLPWISIRTLFRFSRFPTQEVFHVPSDRHPVRQPVVSIPLAGAR
jgi:3,4-dihydroxy 2-butanone 4-phosphate synthase/GTP cyclohydrolase II